MERHTRKAKPDTTSEKRRFASSALSKCTARPSPFDCFGLFLVFSCALSALAARKARIRAERDSTSFSLGLSERDSGCAV